MVERFERFSVAISEISRCWHKLAGEEMKAYGLKGAHATYLAIIARYPQGITVPELCDQCMKDKSDASRMMAILEKKGLVRKESPHKSGYGGTIHLTEEGRQAAEHVRRRASRAVEIAGKDLNDETREIFYSALDSIIGNLRVMTKEGIPE